MSIWREKERKNCPINIRTITMTMNGNDLSWATGPLTEQKLWIGFLSSFIVSVVLIRSRMFISVKWPTSDSHRGQSMGMRSRWSLVTLHSKSSRILLFDNTTNGHRQTTKRNILSWFQANQRKIHRNRTKSHIGQYRWAFRNALKANERVSNNRFLANVHLRKCVST